MSDHFLDSEFRDGVDLNCPKLDMPRLKRAYSMDQWARDFAAAFGAAVPLEAVPTQARGALLAADNDEPEPLFSEAELLEADRARQARKDSGEIDRERVERAHWEEVQRRPNGGYTHG